MRTDTSIEINGATLHDEEHGTGTPLVLIHGGLASSAMWEPHLPDLVDGFRVITPDSRGRDCVRFRRAALARSARTPVRRPGTISRVSEPVAVSVRDGGRRTGALVDRVVPSSFQRCLTLPGADRLLELRWAVQVRRAPVMTPEQHAAASADPRRRGVGIEVTTRCLLCGGARLLPLLHAYDRKHKDPRWDYHVVRCAGCGLLFRHPGIRPERLGELYSSGYYARFLAGKYSRKRIRRYRVTVAPFGRLFRKGQGRRLLDFGCGNGLFLDIAHRRGFDCYGVDLAADAIEVARQKPSGQHAYHGTPTDIPQLSAGGFDVITMWSVLAHLAQPVDDLTMLRSLLAPEGVLLLLTVNAASLKLKHDLEAWGGFTANHLAFFAPDTLRLLLRRAGFGAVVMPPWYSGPVERGTSRLSARDQRHLRRVIDRGNRGNMLRAAAFVDSDGPKRWRLRGIPL